MVGEDFYLNRSNKVWIPSRGKDCQAVGGCSAHNGIRYPGLKKAGLRPIQVVIGNAIS
jgi:hypothetical protein